MNHSKCHLIGRLILYSPLVNGNYLIASNCRNQRTAQNHFLNNLAIGLKIVANTSVPPNARLNDISSTDTVKLTQSFAG